LRQTVVDGSKQMWFEFYIIMITTNTFILYNIFKNIDQLIVEYRIFHNNRESKTTTGLSIESTGNKKYK